MSVRHQRKKRSLTRSSQSNHSSGGTSSSRRGTIRLGLVLAVLVGVNLYVFLWRGETSIPAVMERAAVAGDGAAPAAEEAAEKHELAEVLSAGEAAESQGRDVEGVVEPGDSMGKILRREGLEPPAADELIRALEPHLDFRKIQAGQTYRMHLSADGQVTSFEFEVSRLTKVRVVRNAEGAFEAEKNKADTDIIPTELGGAIESSLYHSIKATGEEVSLVAFFVDVFAYDLNFYIDTHEGDAFRMIVEKEYLNGEFLRYGKVLAAEYSGKAGTFRAFYWKEPGAEKGRYFDEKGRSVEKTFLKTPLKYARVSSKFNPRRMHPILHVRRGHFGVDYAAASGTPVWAAASGKIIFRGRRGGAGNAVIVRHDNGYVTTYMHLSKFRNGQRVGTRVRQKDIIGYVGMTGLATGPHLHFSVKKNGHHIDPLKMKMSRGAGVAKKHRVQFEADTGRLVERLAQIRVSPGGGGVRETHVAAPALPN